MLGHTPENVHPGVTYNQRRSRNWLVGTLVTGAATSGLVYEAVHQLTSGNMLDVVSSAGYGLAGIAGAIATAGCAHSAHHHRSEAWRINDELLEEWRSNER